MDVNIIRSETWLNDNFEEIHSILDETIEEFVDDSKQIINIESKTEANGLSRFWIYITNKATAAEGIFYCQFKPLKGEKL